MEEREKFWDLQENWRRGKKFQPSGESSGGEGKVLGLAGELEEREKVPALGREQWRRGKSSRTCRRTGG